MIRNVFLIAVFALCSLNIYAQKVDFKSDIDSMTPLAYEPRFGLSDFSLDMRNDSAFVHLPYIGEVYTPTLNNDGLNFEVPCEKLSVKSTKKKDGKIVKFSLKRDIVTYDFTVTLWDGNRIDVFMQPSNAQSCSYSGQWESTSKKEKEK